ncbi:hypothetical protein CK203_116381 [Vitis vinifera]|uniref:Uncharacterized protein n=1 Tax=Vitis vinifera TaxID=29760 RepID=A0A438DBU9_VITVI|nr:hypothetical protein CK203_116381 [Vitis vinifera]
MNGSQGHFFHRLSPCDIAHFAFDLFPIYHFTGLILEPISVLMQRVEQDAFTKALQASSELQNDAILPETQVVNEQLGWINILQVHLQSFSVMNRQIVRSTTEEVLSALRRHSSIAQHQRPSGMSFLRKNKGQRLSDGNSRYSNNLDQENGNLKGLQELWNKKSRGTGPPEQKSNFGQHGVGGLSASNQSNFKYFCPVASTAKIQA